MTLLCPNSGDLVVEISPTSAPAGTQLHFIKTGTGSLRVNLKDNLLSDDGRTNQAVRLLGNKKGLLKLQTIANSRFSLTHTLDGWEFPDTAGVEIAPGVYVWSSTDRWDDDEFWIDG